MKKFIIRPLGILMAGALSVAVAAAPPSPKVALPASQAANPVLVQPVRTKGMVRQELRWTFAYKKPVRVGALMTKREKREYQRAMMTARTIEARQQIRAMTYQRLSQRATEQGMFLVFPNSATFASRGEVVPQTRELGRVSVRAVAPRAVVSVHPGRQPPRL